MALELEIKSGAKCILSTWTVNDEKSDFFKEKDKNLEFLRKNENRVRIRSPNHITVQDAIVIGRAIEKEDSIVNLVIKDKGRFISRRHCSIYPDTGFFGRVKAWRVMDLDSANGTFLQHKDEEKAKIANRYDSQHETFFNKLKVGDLISLSCKEAEGGEVVFEVMEV